MNDSEIVKVVVKVVYGIAFIFVGIYSLAKTESTIVMLQNFLVGVPLIRLAGKAQLRFSKITIRFFGGLLSMLGVSVFAVALITGLFYANEMNDYADIYNNSGTVIVAHPVSMAPKDSVVIVRVEKGNVIASGQGFKFKTAGRFVIEMGGSIFRYSVGTVVWESKENDEYGGFENRAYQLNKDGKLFVVKAGTKLPISAGSYQPKGYPLVPEKANDLNDFKIYLAPASL